MCDPISIGVSMLVAGTAAQTIAAKQQQQAMNKAAANARMAESNRQEKLRNERFEQLGLAETNAGLENQQAQLDQAATARKDAYAAASDMQRNTDYASDAKSTAPKVVQAEYERQQADANDYLGQIGDARARLAAFGDLSLGNKILDTDVGNRIGVNAGFARNSASLLPSEVQSAMNRASGKGQVLGTLGGLSSAIGGAALGGGVGGMFGAGAGATGAPLVSGGMAANPELVKMPGVGAASRFGTFRSLFQ